MTCVVLTLSSNIGGGGCVRLRLRRLWWWQLRCGHACPLGDGLLAILPLGARPSKLLLVEAVRAHATVFDGGRLGLLAHIICLSARPLGGARGGGRDVPSRALLAVSMQRALELLEPRHALLQREHAHAMQLVRKRGTVVRVEKLAFLEAIAKVLVALLAMMG